MTRAIEVEIDESGAVRATNPATTIPHGRALLVWQTEPDHEAALLSEAVLAVDWLRPEEDWPMPEPSMIITEDGLPFFPANGRVLTAEMVKAASEDELG
jgi:hypothetical protein